MFELLNNLFGSQNEQLSEKLTEYFQTKRHIVPARCDFFKREMRSSQAHRGIFAELCVSVNSYVVLHRAL